MSIIIDLRSIIEEGVGAQLAISNTAKLGNDGIIKRGHIDYCCSAPISYELTFVNAGEAVHASGRAHADMSTACVRCLCDFRIELNPEIEETFFFEPTEDEYGDPYPVIGDDQKIDIEPVLTEAFLVEAPFAPVHDENCQGLCVKCGADLNLADCGCSPESDDSHPFAGLKDLIK